MFTVVMGVLLVLAGVGGVLFVKRRQFYRRNMAGVEEFNSFSSVLLNQGLEKIISLLSIAAFLFGGLLIVIGLNSGS